jgi:uncharacterized protein
MPDLSLSLALGFGIGVSLGLLGGGGSILTVPALVYIIGQTPQAAVTTSLAIVGANSVVGAYIHNTQGNLNWKVALVFGGAGMGMSYLAAGFSGLFTPAALLVLFGILMVAIAAIMLLQRKRVEQQTKQSNWLVVIAVGAGVGILTGILGVGGGFLIVPALVMLVGLPMYQAVGTSLVIIAANSLAGFIGHLGSSLLDLSLTLVFVISGLTGTFAGSRLAKRIPAHQLRQIFAVFVLLLAIYLLVDNLPKLWG